MYVLATVFQPLMTGLIKLPPGRPRCQPSVAVWQCHGGRRPFVTHTHIAAVVSVSGVYLQTAGLLPRPGGMSCSLNRQSMPLLRLYRFEMGNLKRRKTHLRLENRKAWEGYWRNPSIPQELQATPDRQGNRSGDHGMDDSYDFMHPRGATVRFYSVTVPGPGIDMGP